MSNLTYARNGNEIMRADGGWELMLCESKWLDVEFADGCDRKQCDFYAICKYNPDTSETRCECPLNCTNEVRTSYFLSCCCYINLLLFFIW